MSAIVANRPSEAQLESMAEGSVLRGALVGFGVIGEGHLDGYRRQRDFVVDVVVDKSPERRRAARLQLPNASIYGNLQEALGSEQVDFVDICTPPSEHLEHVLAGLEHDLLVLCEKPLLVHAGDIPHVTTAMTTSSGCIYPCQNYLFAPSIKAMKAALDEVDGSPVSAYFRITRSGHARGISDWNPDWRRDRSISGGGILADHGPHAIYLAEYLLGSQVEEVSCRLQFPEGDEWSETEEVAELDLHFAGVIVHVDLSWRGQSRHSSYEIETDRGLVRLVGDDLITAKHRSVDHSSVPSAFDDPRHGSWFADLFADAHARRNDRNANARLLADALRNVRTIDSAYASSAIDGAPLLINPDLKRARPPAVE